MEGALRSLAAVAVCLVTACGGSDQDGSAPREPTTTRSPESDRRTFIARADAICQKWKRKPPTGRDFERIDHLRQIDPEGYVSEAGELYAKSADNIDAQVRELRRLDPPREDRPQVAKFIAAKEEQGNLADSLAGAGIRGDVDAVTALFS